MEGLELDVGPRWYTTTVMEWIATKSVPDILGAQQMDLRWPFSVRTTERSKFARLLLKYLINFALIMTCNTFANFFQVIPSFINIGFQVSSPPHRSLISGNPFFLHVSICSTRVLIVFNQTGLTGTNERSIQKPQNTTVKKMTQACFAKIIMESNYVTGRL